MRDGHQVQSGAGTVCRRRRAGSSLAEAKGCREAVLVYPSTLTRSLDAKVGEIRVRTLTFSPSGELDRAGEAFVSTLLSTLAIPSAGSLEGVA